ncbi:short-chain dehydrogenase/oxidoreductase [Penicillium chermesinum]|uniref:Short-chain dehydrogenase/oxidoreductase n=1 Tax=Penicillium chermesinum TaxID=63820 RepID=A0A9W9P9D8_9EURO|nr:short-chain dehydrogenase/oxidoreductase [Penicillium chermesinum]KAJ5239921.1 short-chain dehydrogenase/oxidoreductase [Penicillium chermesinum]KAJ6166797.1 short-chain dehydrogenase/oxidoreductase [Penicillium chermesinum]
MTFSYEKVLIIGATSGIGKALATKLVQNGTKVIISGRRKENLETFIQDNGSDKVQAKPFDITQLDQINKFASDVIAENPDLDCIFVNAGIQRPFDFSKTDTVDLDILDQELVINYTAPVRIAKAFIPHLQRQEKQTALAFTTSQLAIIPMLRCPNYGASKAALHHFIITLRTQMQNGPGNVKVLEILPPAEFMDDAWAQINAGDEQIAVGSAKDIVDAVEPKRNELYQHMTQMLTGLIKQFLK